MFINLLVLIRIVQKSSDFSPTHIFHDSLVSYIKINQWKTILYPVKHRTLQYRKFVIVFNLDFFDNCGYWKKQVRRFVFSS